MPPRSMANQAMYIQREAVPGVAETDAMKRVLGLKGTPGWEVEGEDFKASGSKVNTSRVINTETASIDIETVQDYNVMTYAFTGGFGAPISSEPVDTAPSATEHIYELNAWEADELITFTTIWGDSDRSVVLPYTYFNSLSLTVNRGGLALGTGARSRVPELSAVVPTTGVTQVASVPVASRSWDGFIDSSWATLGTSKLLALYEGTLEFGDKYTPDYVINSAQPSFSSVLESEDTDYSGSLKVGFDANAEVFVDDYKAGTLKYLRFRSEGPVIEGTTKYLAEIDVCVRIVNPGKFEAAPNSPARTLPFTYQVTVDPLTNKSISARLINTVAGL